MEGAVYWVDKVASLSTEAEEHPENVYNHRATTTAMRNNLHKSHVGCCYVAAKVRFRQLAYDHHLNPKL